LSERVLFCCVLISLKTVNRKNGETILSRDIAGACNCMLWLFPSEEGLRRTINKTADISPYIVPFYLLLIKISSSEACLAAASQRPSFIVAIHLLAVY